MVLPAVYAGAAAGEQQQETVRENCKVGDMGHCAPTSRFSESLATSSLLDLATGGRAHTMF